MLAACHQTPESLRRNPDDRGRYQLLGLEFCRMGCGRHNLTLNYMEGIAEAPEQTQVVLPTPQDMVYDCEASKYWYQVKDVWVPANEQQILQHLHSKGIPHLRLKGSPYSSAQILAKDIRERNSVKFAGSVAGMEPGIYGTVGGRYLVTDRAVLPTPVEGDWSDIEHLGRRLFGEQLDYVWGWHKQALERAIHRNDSQYSQWLILAGPPACGKSFWQKRVITEMLGGRSISPAQYMTGATTFNADIIACEHLALQDDYSKQDMASRVQLGTNAKNVVANLGARYHGKGKNAFQVDARQWLTMSVNDEPRNLSVLPPLEESIVDKMLLVKCSPGIDMEWPGDDEEIMALEKRVVAQVPAFMQFLLTSYKIPETLCRNRWGVTSYQNPELVARIESAKPGADIEELIDLVYERVAEEGGFIVTDHLQLQNLLLDSPEVGRIARDKFNKWDTMNQLLKSLHKDKPSKFYQPDRDFNVRPRPWVITWGEKPDVPSVQKSLGELKTLKRKGKQ